MWYLWILTLQSLFICGICGSSPRHILLLHFLPKAFVEFIGRDKTREHTCNVYIVKSNNGSNENNVIQSNQDVHVCGILCGYIWWLPKLYNAPWKHIYVLKLGKFFCKRAGAIFISLFSGGYLSTHCFQYLGHFCVHFFFLLFFILHSPMSLLFFATKTF
jgi:hypothetical protein